MSPRRWQPSWRSRPKWEGCGFEQRCGWRPACEAYSASTPIGGTGADAVHLPSPGIACLTPEANLRNPRVLQTPVTANGQGRPCRTVGESELSADAAGPGSRCIPPSSSHALQSGRLQRPVLRDRRQRRGFPFLLLGWQPTAIGRTGTWRTFFGPRRPKVALGFLKQP